MKENKIKQLTDVEHILLRSAMYCGSLQPIEAQNFLFNDKTERFEYKQYKYIPAFTKIVNEIIDNSLDEAIRCDFKKANEIDVSMNKTSIKVVDNGRGVPMELADKSTLSQFEIAFTNARAGSNFDDKDRVSLGMNGVGCTTTNIFSKSFKVTSITTNKQGVLKCFNNLSQHTCKIFDIEKTKKTGTTVEFEPDLQKFGLTEIDDIHINLI